MVDIAVSPLVMKDAVLNFPTDNYSAAASAITCTPTVSAITWTGLALNTVTDASAALDAQGTYVVFGEITEGLDVAEAMLALAPAQGDTPTEEIVLERVEITETPAS